MHRLMFHLIIHMIRPEEPVKCIHNVCCCCFFWKGGGYIYNYLFMLKSNASQLKDVIYHISVQETAICSERNASLSVTPVVADPSDENNTLVL